jgi:hypothetical protein
MQYGTMYCLKLESKYISPGLVAFSGGCNDKVSLKKNQYDIIKPYSKPFLSWQLAQISNAIVVYIIFKMFLY